MAIDVDLALYLLKKSRLPRATRAGLVMSYVVFKTFKVKERVYRHMRVPV